MKRLILLFLIVAVVGNLLIQYRNNQSFHKCMLENKKYKYDINRDCTKIYAIEN